MCMGIPMQVTALDGRWASVVGRGERKRVDLALVDGVAVGDWLLVFIDGARERITPERAAEVDATLDLVADAMRGLDAGAAAAAFELPSAMSAEQLAALTGQAPARD